MNQKGLIMILPLLLIITAVGIISFLLISSTAPLNGLLGSLNPKPPSHAASPVGVWINVTPSNAVYLTDLPCGNFGAGSVVVDPLRPANIYTRFDCQGIWKSTDYGQSWTGPINTGTNGTIAGNAAGGISITPNGAANPPILWLSGIRGVGIGLWKSTNDGIDWTLITSPNFVREDTGPPITDPYDNKHFIITPHELNVLYQSTDGGATWNQANLDPGMTVGCNGVGLSGSGGFVFVNTGNAATTRNTWLWLAQATGGCTGTWRTTNGGSNWTKVDGNEKPHGGFQSYQPGNGVIYLPGVYSALGWGLLRSSDYGVTWTHEGNGGQEAIAFGTPNNVYTMWGWACQFCTYDPNFQIAPQPGTSGWTTYPNTPPNIAGPAMAAVTFDGSNYITVTANFNSGLWRYVEPSSGNPTPTPTSTPSSCPKGPLGDVDCNGKIDIFDYNIVVGNFGKSGTNIPGDIDGNSKVDIFDYNILVTNFGK